ncbi:MAG: tyrosine-type recombinase/integrase, partial [Myxococcota bacterium]
DQIVTPKNGRTREVPLSKHALETLRSYRHLRGEYVFCQERGELLPTSGCVWALRRYCRLAGLRRIGWHALRHSFASHMAMRGVSVKAIQELLGHSSLAMTMRYAHLSPDVRRDAVAVLDEKPRGTMGAHDEKSASGNHKAV